MRWNELVAIFACLTVFSAVSAPYWIWTLIRDVRTERTATARGTRHRNGRLETARAAFMAFMSLAYLALGLIAVVWLQRPH